MNGSLRMNLLRIKIFLLNLLVFLSTLILELYRIQWGLYSRILTLEEEESERRCAIIEAMC